MEGAFKEIWDLLFMDIELCYLFWFTKHSLDSVLEKVTEPLIWKPLKLRENRKHNIISACQNKLSESMANNSLVSAKVKEDQQRVKATAATHAGQEAIVNEWLCSIVRLYVLRALGR